jgi:two-component system copper resistance phosphate regulon response regulator CusR
MRILLVEDEVKVVDFLRRGLEEKGFDTDIAYDGRMGERLALNGAFDLLILDVILPHINGIELCRRVRDRGMDVPVLMLTALGTTEDKVAGFDAGADDYLVKPFEFEELLARIKALTKRRTGLVQTSNRISVGDLQLDLDQKVATREGRRIELTSKEFILLEFLMRNKGRVVSRSDIAEKVWEITFDTGTNVIDVYINFLRKKIDKDYEHKFIQTRIGLGYILNEP